MRVLDVAQRWIGKHWQRRHGGDALEWDARMVRGRWQAVSKNCYDTICPR
jgi:hypothetical protein